MKSNYLYVSPDKGKTIYKEYDDYTKVKISLKEFERECSEKLKKGQ